MPRVLNFYMDDSGTRTPNRRPLHFDLSHRDFFALGGVLINEEDEGSVRRAYADFCQRWGLSYPLHSVEIRHRSERFSWLKRDAAECERFMRDLTRFMTTIKAVGIACVIDRPGYDARYREKYGRRQWHLCQTAFSIVIERAAKFAWKDKRKLRVMPERSCALDERRLKTYYNALKVTGAPFDKQSSANYRPLLPDEFASVLYELKFKGKSSPPGQIADLYLWPIALSGYNPDNRAYVALRDAGRLIESHLDAEQAPACGSKYSCFELVDRHRLGV